MIICSSCGCVNRSGREHCPECGKPIDRGTPHLIFEIWLDPTLERMQTLLERGVDIATLDGGDGHTLLMSAVSPAYLNVDMVKFLLARGADVNAQDDSGSSPLLIAAGSGSAEAVEVLLQAGASPNTADKRGTSPLISAAGRGDVAVVTRLLAGGADPNQADFCYGAPLHCAAGEERVVIVRLLLDHGANIEAMDRQGRTPLACATFHGCTGAAGLLRLRGADRTFDLGDRDPYVIAFTSSMNALSHGCPGFFFGGLSMDAETGLPVERSSTHRSRVVNCREDGHNDGVREFIRWHGLPWNSRLAWLELIGNPSQYIATQTPLPLEPDGPPVTAPDGVTTLQLKTSDVSWSDHQPLFLSSPKLWPGGRLFLENYSGYETNPAPLGKPRPVLGQHWSGQARSRDVTLWAKRRWQEEIEVCWGPAGSELAVLIQRRSTQKHGRPCEGNCILDLQLGAWLSSTISTDWEQNRKPWR